MKEFFNQMIQDLNEDIELKKDIVVALHELNHELHQDNNKAEIEDNNWYYIYDEMVFDNEFDLEYYLEEFAQENRLGNDWIIEELESSLEVNGKQLKELLEKNELELMW